MKLYEVVAQYREDLARLQDLDLPAEVVLDTIEAMQGAPEEKVKAVLIVAMEIEAEGKVRAEHAKRMAESSKGMLLRAEGLRSYAQLAIQNCGLPLPLKYPEFNVNLQANPKSCDVFDTALLPPHMKRTVVEFDVIGDAKELLERIATITQAVPVVTTVPDKKAVLDALDSVVEATGATHAQVA